MDIALRFLPSRVSIDTTRIILGAVSLGLLVGFVYWFFYRGRKSVSQQLPPVVLPSPVAAEQPVEEQTHVPDVGVSRGMATNMNQDKLVESMQPSEAADSAESGPDVEPFVGGPSFDSVAAAYE